VVNAIDRPNRNRRIDRMYNIPVRLPPEAFGNYCLNFGRCATGLLDDRDYWVDRSAQNSTVHAPVYNQQNPKPRCPEN
jgi:hypothetical protein